MMTMNERDARTRIGLFGAGILLVLTIIAAHLPLILLAVPLVIFILGILADTEELHATWYGILSTLGIFDPGALTDDEKEAYARRRSCFWFGEVVSSAALAGIFAVPLGMLIDPRAGTAAAFTGSAIIFLLLFIFLPKLIRMAMKTDTEQILELFGKNEQFRKVFWAVFVALAGLVLAQVADPATVQAVLALLTGSG
ncbi:MAG: hypothetical protein A4E34_02189 [Methanoregula sp. PtaU1.Bin006]|uniref:hypothetical protein n=1 Tax=Methanoregula sp. PtaU1.Bin006 TaxID=1811681 RepID=UPI0009CBB6D0|nr:hypothetical protein [Methanoregula sp. PtaU1.Bin006]OPY32812.1 MAG: hypothetical protein A4E34_02189 [Methanoregula sp. PtaU1.Bin006]